MLSLWETRRTGLKEKVYQKTQRRGKRTAAPPAFANRPVRLNTDEIFSNI